MYLVKHTAILLVFTFSLGTIIQLGTVLHFYSNQDKIAAEKCVNKDKPELNCHGKCHLNKKLKENTSQNLDLPSTVCKTSMIWFVACEVIEISTVENTNLVKEQFWFFIASQGRPMLSDILRPPQLT